MDAFLLALVQDPLHYIEYVFVFFGALGGVLFLAGMGSGARHIFTYSEDAHHMQHVRARATWGIFLCMVTLGLWEIVRVVIGEVSLSYLWLSLVLLTPLWIPWLYRLSKGGGGGH